MGLFPIQRGIGKPRDNWDQMQGRPTANKKTVPVSLQAKKSAMTHYLNLTNRESTPAPQLVIARSSDTEPMVELLKQAMNAIHLPLMLMGFTVAFSVVSLAFLGDVTASHSAAALQETDASLSGLDQENESDQNEDTQGENQTKLLDSFPVIFNEKETGEPVPEVAVDFHGWIGEGRINQKLETDENGHCELKWDGDPLIRNLWFTASKPGYVPVHRNWRSDRRMIDLPEKLEIELVKGNLLQGLVKNEMGEPIENVDVSISLTPLSSEKSSYVFMVANRKTDKDGKWSWNDAPLDTERIGVRLAHSEYMQGYSKVDSLNAETIATLKQGVRIRGRVVDGDRKPVEGATIRFGTDIWGTSEPIAQTDADGQFELINCKEGPSAVTVQAKSFAPQLQKITSSEDMGPLEFQLEPGNELHIKVVDPDGEPIAGAHIAANRWLNLRTIGMRTNADAVGSFVWKEAPAEPVQFDILKQGYVAERNVIVSPNSKPRVITLYPELTITGSVKDILTKDPVPSFQIIRGSKSKNENLIRWSNDRPVAYKDGQFRYSFDEPRKEYYLKVIANGYEPEVSRAFFSNEGLVEFDFTLDKGWAIRGAIRRPNGKAVEGVKIAYATADSHIMLKNGMLDPQQENVVSAETDRTGRFKITPTGKRREPFILLATCEEGMAVFTSLPGKPPAKTPEVNDAPPYDPKKILTMKLQPWGRITGNVYREGKPDAGQEMFFQSTGFSERHRPFRVWSNYKTTSDDDGKFEFVRVPVGAGFVSRVVNKSYGSWSESTFCWQTPVEIVAGEKTTTSVAATGVVVKGTVTTDKQPGFKFDWAKNDPVKINGVRPKTGQPDDSSNNPFRAVGSIDSDGGFEIPDIPPGLYELTVSLSMDGNQGFAARGMEVGIVKVPFTIYADQADAMDLGQVVVKLHDTLDPGELAPDFFADDLLEQSKSFHLRDFHGKLVLLNFWSMGARESLAELKIIDKMHKKFRVSKFESISVCSTNRQNASLDYILKKDYQWHHGSIAVGSWIQLTNDYTIKKLPATFLIGPDGTVLAKNLSGQALLAAISDALIDKASFENLGPTPQRFPVTRTGAIEAKPAIDDRDPPSVLVKSSKSNNEKSAANASIQMLTRSGREIWSAPIIHGQLLSNSNTMAVDRNLNRIYVREFSSSDQPKGRTSAFDLTGQRLWSVECEGPLAVDPKTGNLWISTGQQLNRGTLNVFDPNGNEVAAWPIRAIAMSYDSHSDSMWLVGYEIVKMNRKGKILHRSKIDGWCCTGVAVDADGMVRVAERRHPDIANSRNQIRVLANDGKLIRTTALQHSPNKFVFDIKTGRYWGRGFGGKSNVEDGGKADEPHVAQQIDASAGRDGIWILNKSGLTRIDNGGRPIANVNLSSDFEYFNVLAIE